MVTLITAYLPQVQSLIAHNSSDTTAILNFLASPTSTGTVGILPNNPPPLSIEKRFWPPQISAASPDSTTTTVISPHFLHSQWFFSYMWGVVLLRVVTSTSESWTQPSAPAPPQNSGNSGAPSTTVPVPVDARVTQFLQTNIKLFSVKVSHKF